MELYTKDMFTLEGVEIILAPLIRNRETFEYKLKFIFDQIDEIKKKHFNELFIYERKKKSNPNLIPNKVILTQLKTLEREPTYLNYKREMEEYNSEIKKINKEIELATKQANNNFSFTDYNIDKYIELSLVALESKSDKLFDKLFLEIFNNEFNNRKLYYNIKWMHNYDIYELLVEKAPEEHKAFFNILISHRISLDSYFRTKYYEQYPNDTLTDLLVTYEIEYEKEIS